MSAVNIEPYLRARAAAGPSFRSDGARMAYRSNESGVTQLWELDLQSRTASQRTDGDRVMFAEYSPAGDALVYGTDSGGNERCQLHFRASDEAAVLPLTNNPEVIYNWGGWSPDGRAIAYSANERDQAYLRRLCQNRSRRSAHASTPARWQQLRGCLVARWQLVDRQSADESGEQRSLSDSARR